MDLKTPLYDRHVALNGKLVSFAGYMLPIQYPTGLIAEHMAVRQACGLFDVSHMGELEISGPDAFLNVQRLMTNDMSGMADGQIRYSPMCNERGGVVDDILTYRMGEERYLLVVNAANRHKDFDWIRDHLQGDAVLSDLSDATSQIALQGPRAPEVLAKLVSEGDIPKKYYSYIDNVDVQGISCLVSRTGYTGEAGYELYCANDDAPALWDMLMEAGGEFGLIPCGLGARDTLRLEAGMPLYGHEMDENVSPLTAGLGFFVKLGGDDFIGKAALVEGGEPAQIRVGLAVTGRGIPRERCVLYSGEREIGTVTSGTHCPYLNQPLAMARVDREYSAPDTALTADIRGRKVDCRVVPLPFYKAKK